jgi:predicted O-methyltransferase YrrM
LEHVELYTTDWFSHNIDNWTRWLAEYKGQPGVHALEVGSWEGRSAVWLLKNILTGEGSTLDCVDYGQRADVFRANTVPWADRVTLRCGLSQDVLPGIRGEQYDFIYLDGDHTPFGVMRDAALVWPLLKVGGLMIFDDYLFLHHSVDPNYGKPWNREAALRAIAEHPAEATKSGIDGFLTAMVGQHELVEQTYQLAVRKTKLTVAWGHA